MRALSISILLLIFTTVSAISGRVVNESGAPVENVIVTCGERGVYTDMHGNFTINAAADSLSFAKIGFLSQSVTIKELTENSTVVLSVEAVRIDGMRIREMRYSPRLPNYSGKKTIVVEEAQLEAADVADIIRKETGLYMTGGSLPGESRYVSLQGQKSKHTVVMIDGVVVNSSGNSFDLSSIPASIIERVEIIEGGSGAIAGSGAIGGIVNIVTRRDEMESSTTNLKLLTSQSAGSYDLQKNRLDASLWSWICKTDISVSHLYNRADFEYKDQQGETQKNINNAVSSWDFSLNQEIPVVPFGNRLSVLYREFSKQMIGRYTQIAAYDDANLQGRSLRMSLDMDKRFDVAHFRLVPHYSKEYTLYDNTGSTAFTAVAKGENFYESYGADQETMIYFNEFLEVEPTFTWRTQQYEYKDRITYWSDVEPIKQTNLSPHLRISSEIDMRWFLTTVNLDYRHDYVHSDMQDDQNFSSWKAGLELESEDTIGLKVGADCGTGYSLPSLYDLYWKGGGQAMGNPDLEPEKSFGYQVMLSSWYKEMIDLGITWSDQQVDDLIFWHKSVYGWKPDNIGATIVRNFKMELMLSPVPFAHFSGSWQRTFAEDRSTDEDGSHADHYGKTVPGIPVSVTSLKLNLESWGASIGASWNRIGERYTTLDNMMGALDPYEVLDIDAKYCLKLSGSQWLQPVFYGKLNNLLDAVYEIDSGQPEPGRNWEAGFFYEVDMPL